ncbi:RIP metalloprotease RseP [Methylovirgula sp. HY1]|uniref:RIP metalloprotease RseP n=1 Tax=Methylovirgula sp. HY1 TaxID=2822761 RepID=UPI001C5AB443|nr:RIP metalloprotease RseP [Methylovirgula sp. HY1]QXX73651.1 Metalloprotease MmpA [Methylovirgula sp. HY1]
MSFISDLGNIGGSIVPFVFVLSLVIFFHEFGHFIVGRLCGVKVDAFSLGFGPELAHFTDRRGTRWRLGMLPLGGYVKFHGDANGASMSDAAGLAAMPASERAVTFFTQKVWKRALIVAAGPLANFILAIVIFTGIYYVHGRGVLVPQIQTVVAGSAAAAAGFTPGDTIVSINGTKVESFQDMQRIVQASSGQALGFVVDRHGKDVTLVATPQRREVKTPFGNTWTGVLGIEANTRAANWHIQHYGLIDSMRLASDETWFIVRQTGTYVGGLFTGRESTDQLSGPIRIAEVSGEMARIGFAALLNLAAVLSISIGILNLVPIPLLDGGHLLYYAIEAVRGRALNEKIQQFGFKIGLTLVAGLMILATYNDILRLTHRF